ncbi:MAG: S41 family peptidase [Planctomycetota bacterium]
MMRPLILTLSIAALPFGAHAAEGTDVSFPQHPSLSPDGSTVAFSWAGDLWAVPRSGGVATRLTSHPAIEGKSVFSPDGTRLAFESNRDGSTNIYTAEVLQSAAGAMALGQIQRVTWGDRNTALGTFTPDGDAVLFSSFREPSAYRASRMYRAPLDGGPVERLTDAYGTRPRMGDDGTVVFERGYNPWYRPNYDGPGARDVWSFDPGTNEFTQLTADAGNDGDAWVLPDGSTLFVSSRDGQNNVHRLRAGVTDANARAVRAVTSFQPGNEPTIAHGVRDLAVSADGSTAAFAVWDTLYVQDLSRDIEPVAIDARASADADTGATKSVDISGRATEAVLSPDGKALALVSRGEILVRGTEEGRPTRRVTNTASREHSIAWSPDGLSLYFVSDPDGMDVIYEATVDLSRADLVREDEEDIEEDATDDGDDESTEDEATEDDAQGTGDDAEGSEDDAGDGDGDEGSEDEADEKEDGPDAGERWATGLRFKIDEVVRGDASVSSPAPSPNGRELAYVHEGDIHVMDLGMGESRVVDEGWDSVTPRWAADSVHLVYARQDLDYNSDVMLLDTRCEGDSCAPFNVTRHPDLDGSPRLSRDGKVLVFLSDRDSDNWSMDVYAVMLDAGMEEWAEYELVEYFDEQSSAAKKAKPIDPVDFDDEAEEAEAFEFDLDDAHLRVRRLTSIPAGEGNLTITPAADRIVFTTSIDGDSGLYSVDYLGDERKTLKSGNVSFASVSLTGDKVVHISGGRAAATGAAGGSATAMPVSARVSVPISAEQRQKFREAARGFGDGFYDLKGVDWDAVSGRYEELASGVRTSEAFNRVVNMLFGEVDGSHTGIRGGDGFDQPNERVGYLGIEVEPVADGYRVTRVLADGPADRGEDGLMVGDVIVAVGSQPLASGETEAGVIDLTWAMTGSVGQETLVEVRRGEAGPMPEGAEGPETVYLVLTPISWGAQNTLGYEAVVASRRAEVERLSDGRLGYLHIRGMSGPSVRAFERDLYAAANGREGLIVDVRDNGGGWTTDILLSSLTAPQHAYTIPRGADLDEVTRYDYPRGRRLIYAYQRPMNVLMNANSFSNAEIFAHSIKTIGRGTLIGEQTFGGVISTGGFSLIDGTTVRMPFRGWFLPDGTDMEHNGAIPDVPVSLGPTEEAAGEDPQLEEAVRELLGRLTASASALE